MTGRPFRIVLDPRENLTPVFGLAPAFGDGQVELSGMANWFGGGLMR